MSNEVLVQGLEGSSLKQLLFGVQGSPSPADEATDLRIGTPEYVLMTLAGIANGAGRQSAKVDLGGQYAREYEVMGAFDFTGETPTAGNVVRCYWLPSTSGTQAKGNVGGNSGADGDAPDGALGSITLEELAAQGIFIGSFVCHDGVVVQNGYVGSFSPPTRYGQLLVINDSGGAFENDDVETHIVMNAVVPKIQ